MERSIEDHIEKDKKILDDSNISPQYRRHIETELRDLELYHKNHPGDNHDPTEFEVYCDLNPNASECKIYDN